MDIVGDDIPTTARKSTRYRGAVPFFGPAAASDLKAAVFPFILHGVNLLCIDSVNCPLAPRLEICSTLSGQCRPIALTAIAARCVLRELGARIEWISEGWVGCSGVVDLLC